MKALTSTMIYMKNNQRDQQTRQQEMLANIKTNNQKAKKKNKN